MECENMKKRNQRSQIKHIEISRGMTAKELVKAMSDSGVMGAGRIGKAAQVFEKIIEEKKKKNSECMLFFGLAGAMVPGGMKAVIHDMLKSGAIDVFVVTGENLTHDLIEGLGYRHYKGSADVNDSELNKEGIDRI